MQLSYPLQYDGNPRQTADQVAELEKAGLDMVWVAEAYGFDSPTLMGYLAAKTERLQIAAGILNVFSRTPGAILQTTAGLDNVSAGRAVLGLGASGPQVIEGFHGLPYDKGSSTSRSRRARGSGWASRSSSWSTPSATRSRSGSRASATRTSR
jgi:alkanesulfonate monooxygenase SsuD/methylene tetrahydromethanopterin reductase-like flavin-dependent oxidoreductase (luciferase family)